MGSVIEILAIQALAHQAQGDIPSALALLKRALNLAEPQGFVRHRVLSACFWTKANPWGNS